MADSAYNPSEVFQGHLFGKSPKDGDFEASLRVDADGIHAEPVDQPAHTLPFKGLRLRHDGTGALIATQAKGSWSVSCQDPNFVRALETMAGNELNQQLTVLTGQKVSSRRKHLMGCFLVLVFCGAVLWAIPRTFNRAVNATVAAVPITVDKSLGEAAQEAMDAGGSLVEDEVITEAVQEILDRLTPFATIEGLDYEFRIVRNDEANAYALPGGYITVFTGLLKQSTDPSQVAGVVAHEMAHAKLRHGLLRVAQQGFFTAALAVVFGNSSGLESIAVELFALQQVNSYSQDAETEADLEGVRILIAAQIDPQGLIDSFRTMQERYGDMPDSLAWANSHPQFDARVQSIEKAIAAHPQLPEWEALEIDWDAVLKALE